MAFKVERFVEKPDRSRAQAYFESGHFAWNSGMFVFGARTFMQCLERFKPESHDGLRRIQAAWGTADARRVLEEVYPTLPRISVDYAVMEPATARPARTSASGGGGGTGDFAVQVCTVLTDVRWLDVGSWASYAETLEPDKAGNRIGGEVGAVVVDGKNNLVVGDTGGNGAPAHTVALLGVDDLVVIHTRDATLVMKRDKAEQLKKLHESVDEHLR